MLHDTKGLEMTEQQKQALNERIDNEIDRRCKIHGITLEQLRRLVYDGIAPAELEQVNTLAVTE